MHLLATAWKCALALTLLVSCRSSLDSQSATPWSPVVGASANSTAELQSCRLDGSACRDLAPGDVVSVPALIQSAGEERSELKLDAHTKLVLDTGSRVTLTESTSRRLALRRGHITLQTTQPELVYELLAAGKHLRLSASASKLTLTAASPDRATVDAIDGPVHVSDGAGPGVPVPAGQRAKLVRGRGVDVREREEGTGASAEQTAPTTAGLGTLLARVPGTQEVVSGVQLTRHHVRTSIVDGFARTEVSQEFFNETDRVLEGRFTFRVPADASISRLALWVGDELVEAEMVARQRARRIFKGIVDNTAKPRDPALLEWTTGGMLSLEVFPIEARKSRKLVFTYEEAIPTDGPEWRYTYPIAAHPGSAAVDLSVDVELNHARGRLHDVSTPGYDTTIVHTEDSARIHYDSTEHPARGDFRVLYSSEPLPFAQLTTHVADPAGDVNAQIGPIFALRLAPQWDTPRREALDRVVVIDRSSTQRGDAFQLQLAAAQELLDDLDPDERFAILACDAACDSHPTTGLVATNGATLSGARRWLQQLNAGGAANPSRALATAYGRLDSKRPSQIVYLGSGRASAGPLGVERVARGVRQPGHTASADLRLVAVGRNTHDRALQMLALRLHAPPSKLESASQLAGLIRQMRGAPLADPVLELPPEFSDVWPRELPHLPAGQSLLVMGRLNRAPHGLPMTGTLRGRVNGETFTAPIHIAGNDTRDNPVLPNLWAQRRVAAAERQPDDNNEVVQLSKRHHVLSHATALIVLENDAMFEAFSIPRRHRVAPVDVLQLPGQPAFLSELGTIGNGFGTGGGRLGGSHRTLAPRLRLSRASVDGNLPQEVVQRVVRQNYGRFRLCYERALAVDPRVAGRVSLSFQVSPTGHVISAVATGSLGDSKARQCMANAMTQLTFPKPSAGSAHVDYSIDLSPAGVGAPSGQRVQHRAGTEDWRRRGTAAVEQSADAVAARPHDPSAHQELIVSLLSRGRFEEARRASSRFVGLAPGLANAHDAHARTLAATGEWTGAAFELAAAANAQPNEGWAQLRAARSFSALGDESRACAHFRSSLELMPDDLGAQRAVQSCDAPDALGVDDDDDGGWFEVKVECAAGARCPAPVVVTPIGGLASPFAPERARVSRHSVALALRTRGVYRTLLVGGASDDEVLVRIRAAGTTFTRRLRGGSVQTVAETWVHQRY